MFRVAQQDKSGQLFLFLKLDFLAEEFRVARVFCQQRNYARRIPDPLWNNLVVNVPQSQALAVLRQFPDDVCILSIIRVEVLDSRERRFRNVRMVSAKKIAVVINDVDAVVEPPQLQFLLAITRPPVAEQLFLHLSGGTRCDWDIVLAGAESQGKKSNRYAESAHPNYV